jgi:hemoglobin/transferrin/lactoferrin receptor protein
MKMKLIRYTSLLLLVALSQLTFSQINPTDSAYIKMINLNEVVISVNKIEESKRTVAQYVEVLTAKEIANSQSQTTAELLSNAAGVFVQKSQLGGGSPVLRGFEASRIVLVVDGVRMNNIIYRAGHLQNVITLDNNILDRTEILFGPSSTIYGSDALGGVVHFYTKKPLLAVDGKKTNIGVNFLSRYGSADNELTNHLDFNIGTKKFASLTSFTYSRFDDLKGGKNQNPFYTSSFGERPYYAERINGQDSLVKNSDRYKQVQSGYSQYDILEKLLFQQNEHLSHGFNIQFSNSTDVPRYDRLTDPKGSGLNYAQWYYGPQTRLLTAYDLNLKDPDSKFQNIHLGVNYQNIEESRHTRKFGNDNLTHRTEKVNVLGVDLEFQRIKKSNNIRFGFDGQFNTLKSTANNENIVTGSISPLDTRYPDGDNTMMNAALYFSHTWQINEKLILTDGLRAGFSMLHSTFVDTSFYHFPFTEVNQNTPVYSGSIGIINNPTEDWKLSLLFSTGFRVPNVDDLSKVFESSAGSVIVPNPDLKPEQTFNSELGITKFFDGNTRWENSIYYTRFFDAIVTDKFTFNGQDSIMYDGEMSQVMANQNKKDAYIYGFSSAVTSQCNEYFLLSFMMSYTYGRIKTDSSDYPLDHIPPFLARLQVTYNYKNFSSDFFVNYNGWKKLKNYNLNGEDNEQYAPPEGMPAWFTVNFRASYKVYKMITLQAGVDNIFDTQYRTFASGINAPGRNIYASLRFNL